MDSRRAFDPSKFEGCFSRYSRFRVERSSTRRGDHQNLWQDLCVCLPPIPPRPFEPRLNPESKGRRSLDFARCSRCRLAGGGGLRTGSKRPSPSRLAARRPIFSELSRESLPFQIPFCYFIVLLWQIARGAAFSPFRKGGRGDFFGPESSISPFKTISRQSGNRNERFPREPVFFAICENRVRAFG
jgi:hypothetical protein